jgi:hypothetical protein
MARPFANGREKKIPVNCYIDPSLKAWVKKNRYCFSWLLERAILAEQEKPNEKA